MMFYKLRAVSLTTCSVYGLSTILLLNSVAKGKQKIPEREEIFECYFHLLQVTFELITAIKMPRVKKHLIKKVLF